MRNSKEFVSGWYTHRPFPEMVYHISGFHIALLMSLSFFVGSKSNNYSWICVLIMLAMLYVFNLPHKMFQKYSYIILCKSKNMNTYISKPCIYLTKCVFVFLKDLFLVRNNHICLTVITKTLFQFVECVKVMLWMLVKMKSWTDPTC